MLYVAPERLTTPRCLDLLDRAQDRALRDRRGPLRIAMGTRFPARVPAAVAAARALPRIPRIALDGHRRPANATEIRARLGLADARVFVSSFDRPNIRYAIVDKADARSQLLNFIRVEHPGDAGIVYCLSRRKVDETAAWSGHEGCACPSLSRRDGHGDASGASGAAFNVKTGW
jgi:ATP-dependent DNA helicase RecQ